MLMCDLWLNEAMALLLLFILGWNVLDFWSGFAGPPIKPNRIFFS